MLWGRLCLVLRSTLARPSASTQKRLAYPGWSSPTASPVGEWIDTRAQRTHRYDGYVVDMVLCRASIAPTQAPRSVRVEERGVRAATQGAALLGLSFACISNT